MLNDPFRGGTHLPDITLVMPVYRAGRRRAAGEAPAPHNRSRLLRRFPRPSRRRRRNVSRLHGPVPRNLSGRPPHPTRQNHARRKNCPRCSGPTTQQRPHARRTRRRPRRANRRLPNRSPASPRNLRPLRTRPRPPSRRRSAHLLRRNDARFPAHHSARPVLRPKISSMTTASNDKPVRIAVTIQVSHKRPKERDSRQSNDASVTIDFTGSDPASPRRDQCRRSHHLLGLLLRFPLPAAGRRARHLRPHASHPRHRSLGNRGQRQTSRRRRRRQCRNLAAHRRCAAESAGPGDSRPHPRRRRPAP